MTMVFSAQDISRYTCPPGLSVEAAALRELQQ